MAFSCAPCGRSFNTQTSLDQHTRTSSAHIALNSTPRVQSSEKTEQRKPSLPTKQSVSSPTQPKVQKHRRMLSQLAGVTDQVVKRAELRQIPASGSRPVQVSMQREYAKPPRAAASNSRINQSTSSVGTTNSQNQKLRWSVIPWSEHSAVFQSVSAHCNSPIELKKHNYQTVPYNPQDYTRNCTQCNTPESRADERECTFHPSKRHFKRNSKKSKKGYSCCGTQSQGCVTLPTHDFQLPKRAVKHREFLPTPPASANKTKFRAVTLDCEMAGIAGGAGEAVLVCMADYITGTVILNRLVSPGEAITDMRTFVHGISKSSLDKAILQGETLAGWEAARNEVWKHIDENTIIVGHAMEHDLAALRMIHLRVVDSSILSKNAVGIHRIQYGLKTLCSELLHVEIRKNKGGIHDCLEDVLGTREVVLFCTRNKKAFENWVEGKKVEEVRLQKERDIIRQKRKDELAEKKVLGLARRNPEKVKDKNVASSGAHLYVSSDEEDEILHWSDVAEDMGWPHPDTGYDPWSD